MKLRKALWIPIFLLILVSSVSAIVIWSSEFNICVPEPVQVTSDPKLKTTIVIYPEESKTIAFLIENKAKNMRYTVPVVHEVKGELTNYLTVTYAPDCKVTVEPNGSAVTTVTLSIPTDAPLGDVEIQFDWSRF